MVLPPPEPWRYPLFGNNLGKLVRVTAPPRTLNYSFPDLQRNFTN
jgi:hypothetical protein